MVKRRVHMMNIAFQVYVKNVLCIFLSSIIMGLINIFHFIHDVRTYFTFPSLEGIFFSLNNIGSRTSVKLTTIYYYTVVV